MFKAIKTFFREYDESQQGYYAYRYKLLEEEIALQERIKTDPFQDKETSMSYIKYELMTDNAKLPTKGTELATGYDLYSIEDLVLDIGERRGVRTGLKFDMSALANIDLQVRSRSGLALNHGVVVLNSPGTIDRDYRGEIIVILINHGDFPYMIKVGDKIAQLVLGYYLPSVLMLPTEEVSADTPRGSGGFGSTGT